MSDPALSDPAAGNASVSSPAAGNPAPSDPAAGNTSVSEVDHEHTDVSGGWLRPAVFGAMDGLVTNIALIAGVGGGGGLDRQLIVLTGVAGLVSGAISMGLGEFTSVKAANEQVATEVAKERRELARNPSAEARELADRWVERGLPRDLARQVAEALKERPDEALRVHVQEELGVDPESRPSPWLAAVSSFLCFSVGALIPLVSYLFGSDDFWLAMGIGGLGLFTAGALTSRFTGRRWWLSGLRQLALGFAAAGATYLIGHLIGVAAS